MGAVSAAVSAAVRAAVRGAARSVQQRSAAAAVSVFRRAVRLRRLAITITSQAWAARLDPAS